MQEKIVLGAGCFWGVEALFRRMPEVLDIRVGYMGGHIESPSYEQICTGETGHAEVVEITFDSARLKLEEILDYFWRLHDPTTLNRQGHDIGSQYRSAIFYFSEDQKKVAEKSKRKFDESGVFKEKSVTQIEKAGGFYEAEDYHQNFFSKNPQRPVCHILRQK